MKFVVIDDSESDRYLARRAIAKAFGSLPIEYEAAFLALEDFLDPARSAQVFGSDEQVVVLLDIHMPRMSGFEFLAELANSPVANTVVVLMFTSSTLATDQTQSEISPLVKGYVVKPLLPQQLLSVTAKLGLGSKDERDLEGPPLLSATLPDTDGPTST